ncbi:hypothetical protein FB446DRAFT_709976 [Lentinula raphanica]|nr:hypothetical protein FB446DRAFT_709976 [Lentinula raphanica]
MHKTYSYRCSIKLRLEDFRLAVVYARVAPEGLHRIQNWNLRKGREDCSVVLWTSYLSVVTEYHVKVWISYALFEAEQIRVPRVMVEEYEDEDAGSWSVETPSVPDRFSRVALLEVRKTFEESVSWARQMASLESEKEKAETGQVADFEDGSCVEKQSASLNRRFNHSYPE